MKNLWHIKKSNQEYQFFLSFIWHKMYVIWICVRDIIYDEWFTRSLMGQGESTDQALSGNVDGKQFPNTVRADISLVPS